MKFSKNSCFHFFLSPEFFSDFLSVESILWFFEKYSALVCQVECLVCEAYLTNLANSNFSVARAGQTNTHCIGNQILVIAIQNWC